MSESSKSSASTVRKHEPVQRSESVDATAVRNQNSKSELDRRLDQALAETFPASDPIAIMIH